MSIRRNNQSTEGQNTLWDLPGRIWSTVHRSIFVTPKTFWEGCWRVLSVSMVTGFLTSGVMVWRYPDVVRNLVSHDHIENEIILDIFSRDPAIKEAAMNLIASFIATYNPSHVALINWETQTGIHEVWASSSTRHWPTTTSGVMSANMREATGYLIFDQCWIGDLEDNNPYDYSIVSGDNWLICGLSNDHDIWGYVMVHWEGREVPPQAAEALRIMSERLEAVLFN